MTKQITLPVQGMTCASCVVHVEGALKGVEGVSEANVNLATETASVEFIPEGTEVSQLIAAVRDVGYDVATEKVSLPIGGMT
ncbi:MAG: heavy-metal-associated domain-containing protein, partial [Anaerolineales bacterium]|nr:heavy-metal-associated domain-containing protein [Anaerolineales bacterium]